MPDQNKQKAHALPKSCVPGIQWPALTDPKAAAILAVQFQLSQSQWWHPDTLRQYQLRQLNALLKHACKTIPYYRNLNNSQELSTDKPLSWDQWSRIPILSRSDIQDAGKQLVSENIPKQHGNINRAQTSGSTGRPITAYRTNITNFFWQTCALREIVWHQWDLSKKFAAIRPEGNLEPGKGIVSPEWGTSINTIFETGPSAILSSRTDIALQAEWLMETDPDYLLSMPSNIISLCRHFQKTGQQLPNLKEVRTYGEVAGDEVHQLCRKIWNVPVTDIYSSVEVGHIALQCPEFKNYHILSESILVEILNDDNQNCLPGETGRVVITPLHNFAMPLIRYEIGDYAIVGEPCSCGRGLPVLKRILGRERNMLTLPDGSKHYPSFPAECWADIGGIKQIQLIQEDLQNITANLVTNEPLNSVEEKQFIRMLHDRFGHPFMINIKYLKSIPRSKGGKYEDFASRIKA